MPGRGESIISMEKIFRPGALRSEEHTSELQSRLHLVCRLLLEKKKKHYYNNSTTLQAFHLLSTQFVKRQCPRNQLLLFCFHHPLLRHIFPPICTSFLTTYIAQH